MLSVLARSRASGSPSPPHDEAEKRLRRVLHILLLIERDPQQWTRADLTERFRISQRQIDNDLRLIRAVGFDLHRHRDGYEIHGTPRLD